MEGEDWTCEGREKERISSNTGNSGNCQHQKGLFSLQTLTHFLVYISLCVFILC